MRAASPLIPASSFPSPTALSRSSLATAASVQGGEEGPVFDALVVREAEDLRGPCRRREMDAACEECGDAGFRHLLLRCSKCKNAARHRPNKELDQLVKHVADSGIILEVIVGLAKLFLFPSSVLPDKYQMFQGKPFLWGMFKPRKYMIKKLAPVEQDCTAHTTKEDHVQEKHVLDQQDKAQGDTLDQVVYSNDQPLLDANANRVGKEALSGNGLPLVDMKAIVSANISPADHGQPCSNPEAPPLKLCGFVVSRTPRSAELIQEMQKEGAVLFAVQHVMAEPGSVV